jgi:hypothetical protein
MQLKIVEKLALSDYDSLYLIIFYYNHTRKRKLLNFRFNVICVCSPVALETS